MIGLNLTENIIFEIPGNNPAYLFIFSGIPIFQIVFWSKKLKDWILFSAEKFRDSQLEFDISDLNRILYLRGLGFSDEEAISRVLGL